MGKDEFPWTLAIEFGIISRVMGRPFVDFSFGSISLKAALPFVFNI